METQVIESKWDHPEAHPVEQIGTPRAVAVRGKRVRASEFLEKIREKRPAQSIQSSFFLSVSDIAGIGWDCECGFRPLFDRCPRCGAKHIGV